MAKSPSWLLSRKKALIALPIVLLLQFIHLGSVVNIVNEPNDSASEGLRACEGYYEGSEMDLFFSLFPTRVIGSFVNTSTFGINGWTWHLFAGASNMGHVKTYNDMPLCLMADIEWFPLVVGTSLGTYIGLLFWWLYLGLCILKKPGKHSWWLAIPLILSVLPIAFFGIILVAVYL